jgi:hypothetical protein
MDELALFLTIISGLAAYFVSFMGVQPKIDQQIAVNGNSLSELMKGEDRDMHLSLSVILVAIFLIINAITSLYFFRGEILAYVGFTVMITSFVFLIILDILSVETSLLVHNFFARGYVTIHLVGSTLISFLYFSVGGLIYFLLGGAVLVAVIILSIKLINNFGNPGFPLYAIRDHTLFVYFTNAVNLLLIIWLNLP